MGLLDGRMIDPISKAINNLAEKQSKAMADAIVAGFVQGAKIIATKLQEIEDNKKNEKSNYDPPA